MQTNQYLICVLFMSLANVEALDRFKKIQECINRCNGEDFRIKRNAQSEAVKLDEGSAMLEIKSAKPSATTSPNIDQTKLVLPPISVDPLTKYSPIKIFRPPSDLFRPVTITPGKIKELLFPTTEKVVIAKLSDCRQNCFRMDLSVSPFAIAK